MRRSISSGLARLKHSRDQTATWPPRQPKDLVFGRADSGVVTKLAKQRFVQQTPAVSGRVGSLELTSGRTQRPCDSGKGAYSMDLAKQQQIAAELRLRVTEKYLSEDRVISVRTLDVHPGPLKWKTVSLLVIGDVGTGELKKQELRVQTWARKPLSEGAGYDFEKDEYHWHCEGEAEIDAVRRFLNREFETEGRYVLLREESDVTTVLEAMGAGGINAETLGKLIELAGDDPDAVAAVAASPGALLVAEAVELERRRQDLAELKRIVEDQHSTERDDIHPQLRKMGWIFGGRYVGEARRKELVAGDRMDIPLLRPDGSLHVVELKGARIPTLVEQYRGTKDRQEVAGELEEVPLVVSSEVNRAVGQVMNYLTRLDEQRDHILNRTKIDVRRASATVLIGHPSFVTSYTRAEVDGTMRIYNSHLARVEVRHYAELIESAEAALRVAEEVEAIGQADAETHDGPAQLEDDPWMSSNAPGSPPSTTDPWGSPSPSTDPWVTPSPTPEWLSDEPPF